MTRSAWDRRDDEGAKAYAAFELYRDAGTDRGLREVAHALGKSLTLIAQWSSRHEWVSRVDAFDAQVSAKVASKSIEDHATIRARQARDARRWQELALKALDDPDPNAKPMHPATAIRIWETAAKVEQVAAGIATKSEVDNNVRIEFGYDDGPTVAEDEGE